MHQKRNSAKEEDDLGASGYTPSSHHVNKSRLQSSRGNNSASKISYSNYFDLTEAKLLFNLEGQEDTNIKLFLEDIVQLFKYSSRSDDGW